MIARLGSNAYVIGDCNPRVMHLGDVMVMFPIVFLVCSSYLFSFVSFVNAGVCVVVLFAFCLCVVAVSMSILLSQIRG